MTFRGIVAALPDFALAGAFVVTWIDPFAFGRTGVQYYLLTMLLEFIIVHSSALMGAVAFGRIVSRRRVLTMLGLGLFYTLFVGGFALAFTTWWPLWAFWALTFNRMLGVLLGDPVHGEERKYVQAGWALSVVYYIAGAFATIWLPIPELGLNPGVLEAIDLPGSGLWIDEPHRVLAFGAFYFGMTGVGEVLGWARSRTITKGVPKSTT